MQIYDPSANVPDRQTQRAAQLSQLNGLTIGLLSNRKLNADAFLNEVAQLFVTHYDCQVLDVAYKDNASAPAEKQTLEDLAERCDFMITANGD